MQIRGGRSRTRQNKNVQGHVELDRRSKYQWTQSSVRAVSIFEANLCVVQTNPRPRLEAEAPSY